VAQAQPWSMISCTTRIALEVHLLGIRGGGYQGTPLLHQERVRISGVLDFGGGALPLSMPCRQRLGRYVLLHAEKNWSTSLSDGTPAGRGLCSFQLGVWCAHHARASHTSHTQGVLEEEGVPARMSFGKWSLHLSELPLLFRDRTDVPN
jgi:hypothetical protein